MSILDMIADRVMERLQVALPGLVQKAVVEWFALHPGPTPVPTPVPTPDPQPTPADPVAVFDLAKVHQEIMGLGIMPVVREGVYNYGLSCELCEIPWSLMDEQIVAAYQQAHTIRAYGEEKVQEACEKLEDNPTLKMVAVVNDGLNRFGFRIGPEVIKRLVGYDNQVLLGNIYPESGY